MTQNNIFTYDDYRKFLADYYSEQKEKNPSRFSFRAFSQRAGFQTSNFLHLVINGKRNLSIESARRIANAVKLRGNEIHYFENLVLFNQCETTEEKTLHFNRLASFKGFQRARLIDEGQKVYFSKWFYPVVREMVNLKNFRPEPKWLAAHIKPKIAEADAKEALDVLQTLELVKISPDGTWKLADLQLKTKDEASGHELVSFHHQMIKMGGAALGNPSAERNISAMTMSCSETQFNSIKQKIFDFQEEIRGCLDQGSGASPNSGKGEH